MIEEKDTDLYLDNVPVKSLIERIRKSQVWKRDTFNTRPKDDYTIDLWISESGLTPGPHKIKAIVLYNHYVEFCAKKQFNADSTVSVKKLGEYIKQERLFPKSEDSNRRYYHLNKDITPEADREKENQKKERKKAKKKQSMGIKASDV